MFFHPSKYKTFFSKKDHSNLQSNIDLLISRNSQLENDLHRLQLQQRNNQLALERLDEYEETISQLQDELDQLRLNKKKQQSKNQNIYSYCVKRRFIFF